MQFKTLAEDHRLDLQLGGGELGGDFLDDVLSGGYEHYCIPFYIDVKAPKPLKIKLKITLIYFFFLTISAPKTGQNSPYQSHRP
jgi:hypothetical protein